MNDLEYDKYKLEMELEYNARLLEYHKHLAQLEYARAVFYAAYPDGPPNMFMNVIAPPLRCELTRL